MIEPKVVVFLSSNHLSNLSITSKSFIFKNQTQTQRKRVREDWVGESKTFSPSLSHSWETKLLSYLRFFSEFFSPSISSSFSCSFFFFKEKGSCSLLSLPPFLLSILWFLSFYFSYLNLMVIKLPLIPFLSYHLLLGLAHSLTISPIH